MKSRITKRIARSYLVLNALQVGVRVPTRSFTKKLKFSDANLKRVVSMLAKAKFIKAYSGSIGGGIEKCKDVSDEEFQQVLNVAFKNKETVVSDMKAIVYDKITYKKCSICECQVNALVKDDICYACLESTELDDKPRIARCGHPSRVRYFRCESCLPMIPSEYDEPYSTHQYGSDSYD